jgi:serine/threonine protein kinase
MSIPPTEKSNLENPPFQKEPIRNQVPLSQWSCRNADIYKKVDQVGEGSFGKVYKAELLDESSPNNHKIYALKKILMYNEKEGFPITALREIMILKRLNHKNILSLLEIVTKKEKNKTGIVYLVFEYMEHDISGLSNMKINFPIECIKCIMYQILEGLQYLHKNNVLHRDIKTANILLNNKGEVKIGDFGLARIINPNLKKRITNRVVTLWYRAPELLFGENVYGSAIDVWSVGCVFSELITGVPLFKGRKESEQIEKICEIIGTPDESNWPGVSKLEFYSKLCPKKKYDFSLRKIYDDNEKVDDVCFDLLKKMLFLDPKQRISVDDALKHDFFTKHLPMICKPEELPKIPYDTHEFQIKRDRKEKNKNLNIGNNYNFKGNFNNNNMIVGKKDYKGNLYGNNNNSNVNMNLLVNNNNNNTNNNINNNAGNNKINNKGNLEIEKKSENILLNGKKEEGNFNKVEKKNIIETLLEAPKTHTDNIKDFLGKKREEEKNNN